MSRFVRPETTILTLSNGDRIVVKRELNTGEHLDGFARSVMHATREGIEFRPEQLTLSKMVAYLVNWSITDDSGMVVPILDRPIAEVEAKLRGLDQASYNEIRDAINAHELRVLAENAEEKKRQHGATASSPPSVSVA